MKGELTAAELNRERKISDDRECLTSADLDSGFGTTLLLLCDLRYPHWLHHGYDPVGQEIWWALRAPSDVPAMPEPGS